LTSRNSDNHVDKYAKYNSAILTEAFTP